MRIVYIHQFFTTPAMPGITRSYEMARRLVQFGHEVHMVTSERECSDAGAGEWFETDEAGIHVHWCRIPYSNHLAFHSRMRAFHQFAWRASLKAANLRGDVIFASSPPLTTALPAVFASKRRGIPMVFEVRDLWPQMPIAMGALRNPGSIAASRWLERFAYGNSSRIVALSPGIKAGVVATGYPEEHVRVIPNSCDFNLFNVGSEPGRQFRQRHAWLVDRPLVVYTGTLGLMNGVDYLARLAAAVRIVDPDVRFLIAGAGKNEANVRRVAERLGVLDRSFFMIGSIPKAEVPALLSAADLATSVFVDVRENWSNSANKFFDALAAGTPIAINYGGWQAEMIDEIKCGLVLDVHDVERAADHVVTALRDRDWLANAGAAAQRLGRERFDRDHLAAQLDHILCAAVSHSENRRLPSRGLARPAAHHD